MDALVSTLWLADNLGAADLHIVDASYFLPDAGRNAEAEYLDGHIPGALFLDLATLADLQSPYPSTAPGPDAVATRMGQLGIAEEDRIILYDNSPHKTAARAWWLLASLYGAGRVAVLDGGLGKWIAEGRALEAGPVRRDPVRFAAKPNQTSIRVLDQMKANHVCCAEQVIDARGSGRFTGAEGETRPGLASGHIPGSVNLPFDRLFESNGTWKRGPALLAAFEEAGVDIDKPMTMTCGSGITACVLAFGAHLLGKRAAVYDGSWSEWGAQADTPKATGAA